MRIFRRKPRIDDALNQQIDAAHPTPKDELTLRTLIEQGADLTQPRHVIYYLCAPSREVADGVVRDASEEGFDGKVEEPMSSRFTQEELAEMLKKIRAPKGFKASVDEMESSDWSITCEKVTILSPNQVRWNTEYFSSLAKRRGAEYDGFEAALEER